MDLRELTEDLIDVYEDVDPYGQRNAFDNEEEEFNQIFYALRKWSGADIKASIIDDLQGYIDDGYETELMTSVMSRLKDLAEARGIDGQG